MKPNLLRFILIAVSILTSSFALKAEVISPYLETFDDVDCSVSGFKPKGWGHHIYSSYYGATYTAEPLASGQALKVVQKYPNAPGYDDYLISPLSSGRVTLDVKLAEEGGSVKFYKVTQSGTYFSKGEELTPDIAPELSASQFQAVGFSNLEPGTRLGIRAHNVYIDNFRAATADVEYVRSLNIGINLESSQPAFTGSGNNISIALGEDNAYTLNFKVTLTNQGEVDFTPGDEGYTLTLSDGTNTLGTLEITEPLACGETIEGVFSFPIDGNAVNGTITFRITENISGDYDWQKITIIPWHAEFKLRTSETTSSYYNVNNGDTLDFGSTSGGASKTYWIYNDGTAPLYLTVVSSEGFSAEPAGNVTVSAGSHIPVVLGMDATPTGLRSGTILFTPEDLAPLTLNLTGIALDPTKWYQGFESNALPADMVFEGTGWSFSGGTAKISGNSGDTNRLVTPKLQSASGDKLAFKVAKNGSSTYYTPSLAISRSADRREWTPVATLDVAGLGNAFQSVEATIEEAGEWYYGITASYISIDEIYGLTKVEVPYDLVITESQLPVSGEVNSTFRASATVRNAGNTIAAGTCSAILMLGGQKAAEISSFSVDAGETITLEFNYTPHHAAADQPMFIRIADAEGNIIATSETATITISEEVVKNEVSFGTISTATQNRCPVYAGGTYAWADMVYSQNKIDLGAGTKITRIAFKGKSNGAAGHLKVWIENSELTALPGTWTDPTEAPTLEYDWTFPATQGEEALVIDLSETPFTYTGQALRIRIKAAMTQKSSINWFTDTSAGKAKYDYESSDRTSTTLYDANIPVAFISVESNPTSIIGKITDSETGNPISGASVTARCGEIEYYATSDEAGDYSVELKKALEGYLLSVEAQGYFNYEEPIEISGEEVTVNVAMEPMRDLYFAKCDIPAAATVNHEITIAATVRNVNTTPFEADSYRVRMTVDGETVSEQNGRTLAANDATLGEAEAETIYLFTFTPHEAQEGPAAVKVEIISAEDGIIRSSQTVMMTILPEDEGGDTTLGTYDSYVTNVPVSAFYAYSETTAIYPASLIDVPEGADITEITFNGYYTNTMKEFDTLVEVYLGPESAQTTAEMTLVSNELHHISATGSAANPVEIFVMTLDNPWNYSGGNLKAVIKATTPNGSNINFEADSRYTSTYRTAMSAEALATATASEGKLPVMHVSYTNYVTATGTVRDAQTFEPVEGASVRLTSGNVEYSATTSSDGRYAITVIQRDKDYTLCVEADGYSTYSSANPDLTEEREILLDTMVTSTEMIKEERPDSIFYNAAGLRVNSDSKGILISEGKKILKPNK